MKSSEGVLIEDEQGARRFSFYSLACETPDSTGRIRCPSHSVNAQVTADADLSANGGLELGSSG